MNDLYACFFEYVDKVRLLERGGHTGFPAFIACLDQTRCVFYVIMTGKSLMPRHLGKAIPVRVGLHAIKELVAAVTRGEPENTQFLLRTGRRDEPGYPAAIPLEVLADTDTEA